MSLDVEFVSAPEALARHAEAWQLLAAEALEPNVFYQPELLLPALRELRGDLPVQVALVWDTSGARRLCGLLPVVREPRHRGMPVAILAGWKHLHCFLGTPLVHRDGAAATLGALCRLPRQQRSVLLELRSVGAGGAFEAALARGASASGSVLRVVESHERACFEPRGDADAHRRVAQPSHHRRKEIRRLGRRLAEVGEVDVKAFEADKDPEPWIRDFLALERAGWKGRQGTALATRPEERAFFEAAAREAGRTGRLMMLALRVDRTPIAMKCNFLTGPRSGTPGPGGFCFKIAYDEAWKRFSPGVLLEDAHVSHLHGRRELDWMDSCAVAGHPMIDRLWPDRRPIATLLVGTGLRGRALVRHHGAFARISGLWRRKPSALQGEPRGGSS